ncbi:MAG TPA: zinc-dependent metalloprotease, partial [Longimicrobiales bacterium]|nr:zinc-dependent metalloprotease [Longimicrobiales bacterium]
MHVRIRAAVLLAFASTLASCAGGAPPSSPSPNGEDDETKTIAEVTESSRRIDGLFTLFQDTITGETHLLVRPEQVDREYVYFAHTVDGVVDAGHFRGNFRSNKVVSVRRHFDQVLFVTQPTWLYFDSTSALSRAADANVSPAVLAAAEIVARDSATGDVLIAADPLFASEAFSQVKPSPRPNADEDDFRLGSLSEERSRIVDLRSYPLNTDVVVDYVYQEQYPTNGGGAGVVDARAVTIRLQHSFIEMPENDYRPRFDDPRVGYFLDRQNDMLSTSATPYRDLITRWHLVKRDPSAAVSEPIEPIVWWIENTTPHEFRETIRNAVLEWNRAFEQAGFRNAVVVEVQPDDADWDAGDIRYNVLRWTSSPNPPFGGYGPSFTNPRTGQILGADIMLEYVFVTNRVRQDRIFGRAALDMMEPFDAAAIEHAEAAGECSLGLHLHNNALFGLQALRAAGASEVEVTEYVQQSLHYLLLHEVGHTLGLNHNMKASQARPIEELSNRSLTAGDGLYGSVMDYPDVNLALPGEPQGEYWMTTVGPYDRWAIEFGYSTALESAEAEEARLETILVRSTEPQLVFGNDADDMRSPGKAIDPRVNINDMSSDAIGYAIHKIELADRLLDGLLERYHEPGESWHELLTAYLILTGHQGNAGAVLSRYIGGVYVDRAVQGQPGATQPFTPVARADQKRAMDALAEHIFAPDAFGASPELLAHLAMQRRDFDFFSDTEDPKPHQRILNIQSGVLNHLLHPVVLRRVTDSRLYGNSYPVAEVLADLTSAIFEADARTSVNTMRQALQIEYVTRLAAMVDEESEAKHDAISKSAALQQLRR